MCNNTSCISCLLTTQRSALVLNLAIHYTNIENADPNLDIKILMKDKDAYLKM